MGETMNPAQLKSFGPRKRTRIFRATPSFVARCTAASKNITVDSVRTGRRDPMPELAVGMVLKGGTTFAGRVESINIATRTIVMDTVQAATINALAYAQDYGVFIVPAGVHELDLTLQGGGTGGAGGYGVQTTCNGGALAGASSILLTDVTGFGVALITIYCTNGILHETYIAGSWNGTDLLVPLVDPLPSAVAAGAIASGWVLTGSGGGGGGASLSFSKLKVAVVPGQTLAVQVAAGGIRGAINQVPHGSGGLGMGTTMELRSRVVSMESASAPDGSWWNAKTFQVMPNARPQLTSAERAQPGTIDTGGRGAYGAPMYQSSGGPVGGAGSFGAALASAGACSVTRGLWGDTGAAGGGGASPTGGPGDGGTSTMHADNSIAGATAAIGTHGKAGGAGGCSSFGKGGKSGHISNPSAGPGEPGFGFGSGGGGGMCGFPGGDGAPGIVLIEYSA